MIMIIDNVHWTHMNEFLHEYKKNEVSTIYYVRAMDGIMNCVDFTFTLSAKSNIFAVISFSDADTLISI